MAEAKANSGPTALAPRQSTVLKQFRAMLGGKVKRHKAREQTQGKGPRIRLVAAY